MPFNSHEDDKFQPPFLSQKHQSCLFNCSEVAFIIGGWIRSHVMPVFATVIHWKGDTAFRQYPSIVRDWNVQKQCLIRVVTNASRRQSRIDLEQREGVNSEGWSIENKRAVCLVREWTCGCCDKSCQFLKVEVCSSKNNLVDGWAPRRNACFFSVGQWVLFRLLLGTQYPKRCSD